jgi:hypothetical protein
MATHTSPQAAGVVQFEISVHWSDQRPAVVARLDREEARDLVERLAHVAPGEVDLTSAAPDPDSMLLLMGLQAFYRLTFERDGCLALADVDGGLWTIPARSVQSVRVRLADVPKAIDQDPNVIPIDRSDTGSAGSESIGLLR